MWKNIKLYDIADMVLIQCYSGWRPQELCELKVENIDMDKLTMVGGMKTEAGKNRQVPIHSKIIPLIENRLENAKLRGSMYLFNDSSHINVGRFGHQFKKLIKSLELDSNHRPP